MLVRAIHRGFGARPARHRGPASRLGSGLALIASLVCAVTVHAAAARTTDPTPDADPAPHATLISAASPANSLAPAWQRSAHAWFVVPAQSVPGAARPYVLLHMPPRSRAAPAGTIGRAAGLGASPEGLAAWESEVFLIFPPSATANPSSTSGTSGLGTMRRVARIMALPTVAETWTYFPEAAPEVRPSLSGEGELIAAAGTPLGPMALLRTARAIEGWLLRPSGWQRVDLPDAARSPERLASPVWLTPTPDGPLLAIGDGRRLEAFRALLSTVREGETRDERLAAQWSPDELTLGSFAATDRAALSVVDGQTILASVTGDRAVRLRTLRASGSAVLADVPPHALAQASPVAILPLDGAGRIALARLVADDKPAASTANSRTPPQATAEPAGVLRITEISAHTGLVLFDGPAAGSLLAPWQMQALMLVIGAVMIGVLLFVLRSESKTPLVLPDGFALASPSRRFAAAAIDFGLVFLANAMIWRTHPGELISAAVLTGSPRTLYPVASIIVGGWLYATAMETLTGRTLGKRLFGATVFGIRPAPKPGSPPNPDHPGTIRIGDQLIARPSFAQAAIRNLIHWAVPPLAMLILLDPNWRHPGDVLSSTVVAEPIDPDEEADENGETDGE